MKTRRAMNIILGTILLFFIAFKRIHAGIPHSTTLSHGLLNSAESADEEFKTLSSEFFLEFKSLDVPKLALSYVENLSNIQNSDGINRQFDFFKRQSQKIELISRSNLSLNQSYQYDALKLEINSNLERLMLEIRYLNSQGRTPIPQDGLYEVTYGREWYAYFLKKWASENIIPENLLTLGLEEISKVKSEIKKIQNSLGYQGRDKEFYTFLNGPDFLIANESELASALKLIQDLIKKNLSAEFSQIDIEGPEIKAIPNPTKDTPPGFYSRGVFYYNFFQNSFQIRNLNWLYLHEAMPGHHYQKQVAAKSPNKFQISEYFDYPGYSEGWASYSESLGPSLGAYRDLFSLLGRWEWDLVRSVRIVLDVGINYLGWSKQQAFDFWRENIPNQSSIMNREIDRVIRWPAQAASYKVGEVRFRNLRKQAELQTGPEFDPRRLHSLFLDQGPLPMEVVSKIASKGQN